MKKNISILLVSLTTVIFSGCSTAYKSAPEKTVYFLQITEAGKDVKDIAARSGYYDAAIGGSMVSIGSSMGLSPSSELVGAVIGGLISNTSNLVQPDEVFIAVSTSNEGTFRGVKTGRVKFNPEMLLWVKEDALREYTTEDGKLSLQLANRDIAAKRKAILESLSSKPANGG